MTKKGTEIVVSDGWHRRSPEDDLRMLPFRRAHRLRLEAAGGVDWERFCVEHVSYQHTLEVFWRSFRDGFPFHKPWWLAAVSVAVIWTVLAQSLLMLAVGTVLCLVFATLGAIRGTWQGLKNLRVYWDECAASSSSGTEEEQTMSVLLRRLYRHVDHWERRVVPEIYGDAVGSLMSREAMLRLSRRARLEPICEEYYAAILSSLSPHCTLNEQALATGVARADEVRRQLDEKLAAEMNTTK